MAYIEQRFHPAVGKGWCLNQEWCENGHLGFPSVENSGVQQGESFNWKTACCPFLLLSLLKCPHNDLFPVCYFAHSPLPSPALSNALIFLEKLSSEATVVSNYLSLFPLFCFFWRHSHLPSSSGFCVWSGLVGHSHQASPVHLFLTAVSGMSLLQDLQGHGYRARHWLTPELHDLTYCGDVCWAQGVRSGGGRKHPFPLGSESKEQQEPPDLAWN